MNSLFMNSVTMDCSAKINLALDVVGKREDGYHEVELIYVEIPLKDKVTVALREDGEIRLTCDDSTLPTDSGNIAYRAAEEFFSQAGMTAGADIRLEKKIPHGAGLAGGSADAAGVLKALNELTGDRFTREELMQIGARLGADVPFCILGGCALGEGIGEVLTPLPPIEGFTYVIAKPKESVATAYVYKNLDIKNRPENLCVPAVAEGIRRDDWGMICENAENILESVTAEEFPVICDIKNCLSSFGAVLSMMSGSGTSVFGVFEDAETAKAAAEAAKEYTDTVYVV